MLPAMQAAIIRGLVRDLKALEQDEREGPESPASEKIKIDLAKARRGEW
jgi:hypothetical protein